MPQQIVAKHLILHIDITQIFSDVKMLKLILCSRYTLVFV